MKPMAALRMLGLASLCFTLPIQAENVLVNGGFETGDFAGWKFGAAAVIDGETPLADSYSATLPNAPNPPMRARKLSQAFAGQTDPVTVEFTFAMADPEVRGLQVMLAEGSGNGFVNLQVTDLDNDGDGDVQIYHSPSRRFETVLKDAVSFGMSQTLSLTFNRLGSGLNYDLSVGNKSVTGLAHYQNQVLDDLSELRFVNEYGNTAYEIDNVQVKVRPAPEHSLWDHLSAATELADARNTKARFDQADGRRVLQLKTGTESKRGIAWVAIPPPPEGWDLRRVGHVKAGIANTGTEPAEVTLWVVSSAGWAAVGGAATLQPNATATLSCNLRETYPDGTTKLDPARIQQLRIMVQRVESAELTISSVVASGTAMDWIRPSGRIDVPDMLPGRPAPGRRVRYRLSDATDSEVYSALYLPPGWEPGKRYPVIAEFPGNIFYSAKACWSTGRPEQCQMGYGIIAGSEAIWVSLPFVDRETGEIAESGFGSNDGADTVTYTMNVMEAICQDWGGDRNNLFLSGFSRGSIACGYIGLRNDRIAGLWKGIVGCQHYDGSRWRQSSMAGAVERAPRFRGKAIFQIDNRRENYQPVVNATDSSVQWTWTRSGLGYHATAMFLDDRPATKQLRQWFRDLVVTP